MKENNARGSDEKVGALAASGNHKAATLSNFRGFQRLNQKK